MNSNAKPDKPLTAKQQIFVREYLSCFNGAEAARRAGYSGTRARSTASELLANRNISEHIQKHLSQHMTAEEALSRLAAIARGDISSLMDVSEDGFSLDLATSQRLGLTKLIKKIKQRTTVYTSKKYDGDDKEITDIEIELYSAHEALRDILKIAGKYVERHDLTTDGKSINLSPEQAADRIAYLLELAKKRKEENVPTS